MRVIRFLSADTIEEGIYAIAQDKLQLERDLSASGEKVRESKPILIRFWNACEDDAADEFYYSVFESFEDIAVWE